MPLFGYVQALCFCVYLFRARGNKRDRKTCYVHYPRGGMAGHLFSMKDAVHHEYGRERFGQTWGKDETIASSEEHKLLTKIISTYTRTHAVSTHPVLQNINTAGSSPALLQPPVTISLRPARQSPTTLLSYLCANECSSHAATPATYASMMSGTSPMPPRSSPSFSPLPGLRLR